MFIQLQITKIWTKDDNHHHHQQQQKKTSKDQNKIYLGFFLFIIVKIFLQCISNFLSLLNHEKFHCFDDDICNSSSFKVI